MQQKESRIYAGSGVSQTPNNTMDDKEKQKYDRKKLGRVMAYCLGSVDILIIISLILGEEAMENLENIFSAIVIFIVILTIVLANTICRK